MKIKPLQLWHLPLTSQTPYYMAAGKTCDTVETVVLCVETDGCIVGWGEVSPIPHCLPAYVHRVGQGPLVYGDWNCGVTPLDAIRVGGAFGSPDLELD